MSNTRMHMHTHLRISSKSMVIPEEVAQGNKRGFVAESSRVSTHAGCTFRPALHPPTHPPTWGCTVGEH
jgi:hypothetical protein